MSAEWIPLHTLVTETGKQNRSYIESLMPELHERLRDNPSAERLRVQMQGGVILCRAAGEPGEWIVGGSNPAEEVRAAQERVRAAPPEVSLLVLAGTAIGYALAAAIPDLLRLPERRILALEKSTARLEACLQFLALHPALGTGRLHLDVCDFSPAGVLEAVRRWHLETAASAEIVWAPETTPAFSPDVFREALRREAERLRERKQAILFARRDHAAPAQSPRSVRRALLVDCWKDAPGQLHLKAIQQALESRGVQTRTVSLQRYRMDIHPREYRRQIQPALLTLLEQFQPDLLLSFGYHAPQFLEEDFFSAGNWLSLQAVSNIGYFDTVYYPGENTALIEENLIPLFRRRGAPNPFFIPLMADCIAPQPIRTDRRFPVVFVGNSLGLAPQAVNQLYEKYAARDELIRYIKQAEEDFRAFDPAMNLYSYIEQNPIPQADTETEIYDIFRFILCQGSAARRVQLLESIADRGLVIFGGDWGNALSPHSPLRNCVRGYLSIHEEAKTFATGHLFVNIQSVGHVTGPNMRFFNVAGAGAMQISDGNFGHMLQPDRECVYYQSAQEFRDRVLHYLNRVGEADEIRQQAQDRVRKDWTYGNWVEAAFQKLAVRFP